MKRGFFIHIHPPEVTTWALRPLTTLGLGIVSLTLFIIVSATGLLLMLYYVSTLADAHRSTEDIQYAVVFGNYVRALHRFGAHGMVLTVFLHLLRVICTGAFLDRCRNWYIGIGLFVLTLMLAFTGYLLPADQLAYWAVTVSANLLDHFPFVGTSLKNLLLGGNVIGNATIVRFYALHVAILPSIMFGLIVWHLWRIRKDNGLAVPNDIERDRIPTWPLLILWETLIAILTLVAVSFVASLVDAPLGAEPDIHHPSNPEKTPWYFLFLQEMVSYSTFVGGFIFPSLAMGLLAALPFLKHHDDHVDGWLGRRRERHGAVISFVSSLIVFFLLEWMFHHPIVKGWLTASSPIFRDLINPATGMLVVAVSIFTTMWLKVKSLKAAALAAFISILTAVIGFTFMAWCRGPGWIFYPPFAEWPNV